VKCITKLKEEKQMLKLNMTIMHQGISFNFETEVQKDTPHTFEVGEEQLGDKLFYILCGVETPPTPQSFLETTRVLPTKFKHPCTIADIVDTLEQVDRSPSESNNVLALGDPGMFVKGTVQKNIYAAIRARFSKEKAKEMTLETLSKFSTLDPKAKLKTLTNEQLYILAQARSSHRTPKLIVINKLHFLKEIEIDHTQWQDAYIVVVA